MEKMRPLACVTASDCNSSSVRAAENLRSRLPGRVPPSRLNVGRLVGSVAARIHGQTTAVPDEYPPENSRPLLIVQLAISAQVV